MYCTCFLMLSCFIPEAGGAYSMVQEYSPEEKPTNVVHTSSGQCRSTLDQRNIMLSPFYLSKGLLLLLRAICGPICQILYVLKGGMKSY